MEIAGELRTIDACHYVREENTMEPWNLKSTRNEFFDFEHMNGRLKYYKWQRVDILTIVLGSVQRVLISRCQLYSCAIDHDGKETLLSDFVLIALLRSRCIEKKLAGVIGHKPTSMVFFLEEKDLLNFMKFNWCAPDDHVDDLNEWIHREELKLNAIIYHENGTLKLPIDINSTVGLKKQKHDKNYRQKTLLWELAPGPFRTDEESTTNKVMRVVESIANKDKRIEEEKRLEETNKDKEEAKRLKRKERSDAAKERALAQKNKQSKGDENISTSTPALNAVTKERDNLLKSLHEQQAKSIQLERVLSAENTMLRNKYNTESTNKRSKEVEDGLNIEIVKRQRSRIEEEEKRLNEDRLKILEQSRKELFEHQQRVVDEQKRVIAERAKEDRLIANEREMDNKKRELAVVERDYSRSVTVEDRVWQAKLEAEKAQAIWEREREAKKLAFDQEMALLSYKVRLSEFQSNVLPTVPTLQSITSTSSSSLPSELDKLKLRREVLLLELQLKRLAE
jgi:hypothetical protein